MVHIGIIGDYNSQSETHTATNISLELAGSYLGTAVETSWIPTRQILKTDLRSFDAYIVNTGVYEDRDAVLYALRVFREGNVPTLAVCGGFQHMIIEFSRNVLGLNGVGHAEFDAATDPHIIVPLTCSLRGQSAAVAVVPDSHVGRLYQDDDAIDTFYCSFGINTTYLRLLSQSSLAVVGTDGNGLVRVTELLGHPFFIGTLFVPQARALNGKSHPLINGLVKTANTQ